MKVLSLSLSEIRSKNKSGSNQDPWGNPKKHINLKPKRQCKVITPVLMLGFVSRFLYNTEKVIKKTYQGPILILQIVISYGYIFFIHQCKQF